MFVTDVNKWMDAVKKAFRNGISHWTDADESAFWAKNEQYYRDSFLRWKR
jgi:hypothetical protein